MVREYIKQNKDVLKVIVYFPKGSSEFNAIEECWRRENTIYWFQNTIQNL
jgi:transposase